MNNQEIPIGYCQCGCGQITSVSTRTQNGYKKGQHVSYSRGHNGGITVAIKYTSKIRELEDGTRVKFCANCQKTKEISKFSSSSYSRDKIRSYCKECEKEQAKEYYKRNPTPVKESSRRQRKKIVAHLRIEIDRIRKRNPCSICGEKEPCVLDFHHYLERKGEGRAVTQVMSKGYKQFNEEIKKCVILCANCHRKVHAGKAEVTEDMLCKEHVLRPKPKRVTSRSVQ